MTTGLTQAAAHAFVGEDDGRGEARAFYRIAGGVQGGMDAHELDGAVASGVAFIDAELARLCSSERQAVGFDPGQAHARDALFLEGQRANRASGADLATIITGRFATGPVGHN